MKNNVLAIVSLCFLGAFVNLTHGQTSLERLSRDVTIYRDVYGVPHVFGGTYASTVF